MTLCMLEFSCGDGPELPSDLDVDSSSLFETASLNKANSGVDDSFCREPVGVARLQPKHVARQVKGTDLTPSVGEQFVSANRSGNHLVDIFGGFVLAVDFLILAIGDFTRDKT